MVTAVYVLANIAYLAVLPAQTVATSSTIAMQLGIQVWGSAGAYFFALMVVLSSFGAVNGNVWAASRVMVAAAEDGIIFPKFLAHFHRKREVAVRALVLTGIIGSLWCIPGDFTYLANIYSFTGWLWYGITIAGLIYMRFSADMKTAERPFRVWLPVAIVFVIIDCYLVVAPLVDAGSAGISQYIICIVIGLLAVPVWFIRVYKPAIGHRLLGWIPWYVDVSGLDKKSDVAQKNGSNSFREAIEKDEGNAGSNDDVTENEGAMDKQVA